MAVSPLTEILNKHGLRIVTEYEDVARLPSGSLNADIALGGGWARGRLNEVWGPEHFGKSLLAMIAIGRTVRMGGTAVLFDMEHSFDQKWARHWIDVDNPNFILVNQTANTYAERILDTIHQLAEQGVDLIVLDSKDALVFEAEVEGQTGNANMGIRSKRFTYFATRLSQIIGDGKTTFLFVSQVRSNIGDQWHPETTSGGHALDHFSAIRMHMRTPSQIKQKIEGKDTVVGSTLNGLVHKNKTAKAYLMSNVDIREFKTDSGSIWTVDTAGEVMKIGTELGLFTLADGTPYAGAGNVHLNGENYGSKNAAIAAWRAEPVLCFQIETAIRAKLGWVK